MSRDRIRVLSDNDLNVVWTQFLSAATEIHTAMCLFSADHPAQSQLNSAMHSVLIGAEQCRQQHAKPKELRPLSKEEEI